MSVLSPPWSPHPNYNLTVTRLFTYTPSVSTCAQKQRFAIVIVSCHLFFCSGFYLCVYSYHLSFLSPPTQSLSHSLNDWSCLVSFCDITIKQVMSQEEFDKLHKSNLFGSTGHQHFCSACLAACQIWLKKWPNCSFGHLKIAVSSLTQFCFWLPCPLALIYLWDS